MATKTKGLNMKVSKTAIVSGLHLRLDVPTKCGIVESVLNKTFKTKKEQNAYITLLALQSFINPVTIKLWCGKYQNTWKLGKALPKGTMSFAFATIPNSEVPIVSKQLKDFRDNLQKFTIKTQTSLYGNLKQSDLQTVTPGSILNKLIINSKG